MTTRVLNYSAELKEVERSSGKKGVDKHVAIEMEYTFHAEDGSSVTSSVPAEGLDSGDKATNKALSAALKYALIQTFSIPTEDMAEADFESPEIGKPVTKATPYVAPAVKVDAAPVAYTPPVVKVNEHNSISGTVTLQPIGTDAKPIESKKEVVAEEPKRNAFKKPTKAPIVASTDGF